MREGRHAEKLAAIADWCRRYTPLAALDAPDGVMLDITGAAHLFGGEAAMMARTEQDLARHGLRARSGLAGTPEAAWALARYGEADRRLIADGAGERTMARLVSNLPIAALQLDPEIVTVLSQTGLKRIGDIILRPRAPLTARFGKALFDRLDAMLGRAKNPISPRFEAPAYISERRFADGIVAREAIEGTIAALAGHLAQMLEQHDEGARQLSAWLFRVDGKVMRLDCATSRPQRDARMIARLFRERIEAAAAKNAHDPLDAGYGFDLVRLAVMAAEPLKERQQALPAPAQHAQTSRLSAAPAVPEEAESFSQFLDRMSARFGAHRVLRFEANDTHIPEHAVIAMHAISGARGAGGLPAGLALPEPETGPPVPERPLRMFERPEPVEAIAMVPDGPPLKFRWRRVMHEVTAFEGPERIAPEWWKGEAEALTRDYFRVEDRGGRRFWLYREGLYERETQRPRWFMHGLFG